MPFTTVASVKLKLVVPLIAVGVNATPLRVTVQPEMFLDVLVQVTLIDDGAVGAVNLAAVAVAANTLDASGGVLTVTTGDRADETT